MAAFLESRDALPHPMCGIERQFREPRTLGRREVVMKYDEQEELEATGEWLLKINTVGFSEDLMYVPSELTKMGVMPPPVDVVDRLNQLREIDPVLNRADHGIVELAVEHPPSSVLVLERPQKVEAILEVVVEVSLPEPKLVSDYDSLGPWGWVESLEKMIEDSVKAVLAPEPGLHTFNELASLTHWTQRGRGKRARSSVRSTAQRNQHPGA